MLNEAAEARRQRGLAIAATTRIFLKDDDWMVQSQSQPKRYRVAKRPSGFRCDCPDFEDRGEPCKHIFAVEFVIQRETAPDGTVLETRAARVTYAQQWPAYHRAQCSEKEQFCTLLRDLLADVPSPEQKRGRPALPLGDMIFSAAFKVYSTVSARRFMSDLRVANEKGFISRTPHYNSIFNMLDKESLTPVLYDLITRAALPLKGLDSNFAVDSTGFGVNSFYRHFSVKYGKDRMRRDFLKLHAMIGTKTNVLTAVRVATHDTHDSPELPSLVSTTAQYFDVNRVSADKAYSSNANLAAIVSVGAEAFIPFKTNATASGQGRNTALWNKLFHFFQMNQDEFMPRYHTRSNIESTFSAMKRKFGDTIRSKTPVAQQNELLLKCLCHNVVCVIHEIHASGAVGQFPALMPTCPIKVSPAQQRIDF